MVIDPEEKKQQLQERIADLTARLLSEVTKVNAAQKTELESLASHYNKALDGLAHEFNQRLLQAQEAHETSIANIEEEILYLKELADSQHLMLQNNIEYIKALEQRFIADRKKQEE